MQRFDHLELEKKWQEKWEKERTFAAAEPAGKKKYYCLDMFPYPSGAGLHVGHPLGYFGSDIIARKRRMEGFNVLHPMGWDAFGLPAENYAIKTGVHPRESTWKNADNFRRQLKMLGLSFDWSREISSADPEYYRWTQWIFLFLYKNGLAYKKAAAVNWCETDHTVLANEQVVNGNCERCGNAVIQKNLEQWFFRVTNYADRLIDGLDELDWPEKIKAMQTNWIGRSEGAQITFSVLDAPGATKHLTVFTTRPDTLYGATFLVVAPESPLALELATAEQRAAVEKYRADVAKSSELDRQMADRPKTGVFTGTFVQHPLTGAKVPVYAADYVLAAYGTGAIMAVPAHDERDFAFAKAHDLPIVTVIAPADNPTPELPYTEAGVLHNSGAHSGKTTEAGAAAIVAELNAKNIAKSVTTYRLRDWLVSRQRYWGAPIPIVYCEKCGEQPVPEEMLPVMLPEDVDFRPTGESPLARSASFNDGITCPNCKGPARPEHDTMDTFVDSSWYFLRYASPHETRAPFNEHAVKAWAPVDMYVGGAEHAVLHLLFARFFTKALHDHGMLDFDEPFLRLRNQGMILGENGEKMSKSRGNVVNPDDVVREQGADTLRVYEMFMGDFGAAKPWDTKGIAGARRFLDRVWSQVHEVVHKRVETVSPELERSLHKTIKKVGDDIEAFKFNTAVSAMMILLNEWEERGGGDKEFASRFVRMLSPFAPHLCEELWALLGHETSIAKAEWPSYDASLLKDATVNIVIQVNGKVRDRIEAEAGLSEEKAKEAAIASPKIAPLLEGKTVAKMIYVQDKLINLVLE